MSQTIKEELQETMTELESYARKLTNMLQIIERTVNNPAATNNSAMDLISDFKTHPWVDKQKLGTLLTGVHKALYRDANAKLAAKIAEQRAALAELNPIKITKKKS